MPVNPLQGGYMPTDIAYEHHQETTTQPQQQQQQQQQVNKTETKQQLDSPTHNPEMAQITFQQGEAVPIQQSQESAETRYTDRESQGGQSQQDDENAVEEMEAKTKKSIDDLQKGLEQVADGIEQLKELSQAEAGMPAGLDEKLQKISTMGQKLVVDIEQTVEQAVSAMLEIGESFFATAVAELTASRVTIDELINDLVKCQARIPTPEVRDQSQRAEILRRDKEQMGLLLNTLSETTNVMLETAETGLRELLVGNEEIRGGFQDVNRGEAEGFKRIEAGFRALFASINIITDATMIFRQDAELAVRELAMLPEQLELALGSRNALGLPERLAGSLWQSPERIEQSWRAVQGNLGVMSAAMARFGTMIETNFEKAARAVVGEGQLAVDCVNTDLGDIKEDAKQTLSTSAAEAVDQILEGADQVENALDDLIEVGEKKHQTIKRGSVSKKLPSHFNVRL